MSHMSHGLNRPPTQPTSPLPPPPPQRAADPLADYHRIADTIGGLPNLRPKDNLHQTVFILVVSAVSALVGLLIGGFPGVLLGLLFGLFGSVLVSGMVLMVLGFVRAARK